MTNNAIDKAIAALEAAHKEYHASDTAGIDVMYTCIDEALTELKAARQSGVPDGWVLVPREITPERADVLGIPAQLYAKIINGVA